MSSSAKIGYDLNVLVTDNNSSSHWSIGQSTEILAFKSDGKCAGTGNSSRYISIANFAGVGLKETGYTKQGRLIESNQLGVASTENWINIVETATGIPPSYTAEINESLPTVLYSLDDLVYSGQGMRLNDIYSNGNDKILTDYTGTTLTKSVKYGGTFQDAMIFATVTPTSVDEKDFENRTSAFSITSASDKYTGIGFKSNNEFIEQTYQGKFQLEAKFIKTYTYKLKNESEAWLECCGLCNDKLSADYKFDDKSSANYNKTLERCDFDLATSK